MHFRPADSHRTGKRQIPAEEHLRRVVGVVGHPRQAGERRADVEPPLGPRILHHLGRGEEGNRPDEGMSADTVVVVEHVPLAAIPVDRARRAGGELEDVDGGSPDDEHPQRTRSPLPDDVPAGITLEDDAGDRGSAEHREGITPLADVLAIEEKRSHVGRLDAVHPRRLHRRVEAGVGHQGPCAERRGEADEALAGVEVSVIFDHLVTRSCQTGIGAVGPGGLTIRDPVDPVAGKPRERVDRLGRRSQSGNEHRRHVAAPGERLLCPPTADQFHAPRSRGRDGGGAVDSWAVSLSTPARSGKAGIGPAERRKSQPAQRPPFFPVGLSSPPCPLLPAPSSASMNTSTCCPTKSRLPLPEGPSGSGAQS